MNGFPDCFLIWVQASIAVTPRVRLLLSYIMFPNSILNLTLLEARTITRLLHLHKPDLSLIQYLLLRSEFVYGSPLFLEVMLWQVLF